MGADMTAGDTQRVWFTEMIERLRARWDGAAPFESMVELRNDLDAMLQQIRSERHIPSPRIKCLRCGRSGVGAAPHVSVRAMILSVNRFGIAPAEQAHALEKGWAAHRKEKGLDLYGKPVAEPLAKMAGCGHPRCR
jgi:hypothetical protein